VRTRYALPDDAVSIDVPHDLVVRTDPTALETVLKNLLDNAVKYSATPIKIAITVRKSPAGELELIVRDNGIGIAKSQLKRIFRRFYRAPAAAGQVKGTGLGLFIVRSIARRHGGDVLAESEGEGRGSAFTLRLPRVYRV
jgi:signal transduction histidine kinase